MKARILAITLFLLAVLTLLNVPLAQANVEPVILADTLFTALNQGKLEVTLTTFAENAVIENWVRQETYRGAAEIGPMLQAMQREGRQFDIVRVEMVGKTATLQVEISDHGQVWSTETLVVEVEGGKIHNLKLTAFQLKL